MTSQLRVTSLLASRKSGVEQTREQKGKHASTIGITGKPAVTVSHESSVEVGSTTVQDQLPSQHSTPTGTRLTRSRSGSLKGTSKEALEKETDVTTASAVEPVSTPPAAATPVAHHTPSKRKHASSSSQADDEGGSERKKAKQISQETQTESTTTPAVADPAAVTSRPTFDEDANMADVAPPSLTTSTDDQMDMGLPFELPPLEPLPVAQAHPTSAASQASSRVIAPRGTSRGVAMSSSQARANSRAATAVVRRPTEDDVTRHEQAQTDARAAMAQTHRNVMDLLDSLSPETKAHANVLTGRRPPAASVVAPLSHSTVLLAKNEPGVTPIVLPFPTSFKPLIALFAALDSTMMFLQNRLKTSSCLWDAELREPLKRVLGKEVSLRQVQSLMALYPGAFTLQEKLPDQKDRTRARQVDYALSFGPATGLDEDQESKVLLAQSESGVTLSHKPTGASLHARRAELERRMSLYVYKHHQEWLRKVKEEGVVPASALPTAASSSAAASSKLSTASSSKLAPVRTPLTPADLSSISAMLVSPLSRLPCWHPWFRLDYDVPPVQVEPLPMELAKELIAKEKAQPISLKQLAMQKQSVPQRLSLESENRGGRTSTNNGSATPAAAASSSSTPPAAASTVPVASSSNTSSSSAPALTHRSLSVLSSAVRERLAASMASSAKATLDADGDPVVRERLRQLHRLPPLYDAINAVLGKERRTNMPLGPLLEKVRAGAAQHVDHGDFKTVRTNVTELTKLLPHWIKIVTVGSPPYEVAQTSKNGQDRNHTIMAQAIRDQERKLLPPSDLATEGDDSTTLATVKIESSNSHVHVKREGEDTEMHDLDEFVPPAAAASSSSSIVKHESSSNDPAVKSESIVSIAKDRASAINATMSQRLATSPFRSPVRSNVSSRSSSMAAMGHSPAVRRSIEQQLARKR